MNDPSFTYEGSELEIFSHATTWKKYFSTLIAGNLGKTVLEVGAGMGASTSYLINENIESWMCLEPDAMLASKIQVQREINPAFAKVNCCQMILAEIDHSLRFDTILYLDVLEHIEDDDHEISMAVSHLNLGGRLIILAPAHQHLYSPFDKAIGHYRRYSSRNLAELLKKNGLEVERSIYIDCLGYFLSLGNKLFLQQSSPTKHQIAFWDKFIIPLSKFIDPLMMQKCGKSTLVIGRKENELQESPLRPGRSPARYFR